MKRTIVQKDSYYDSVFLMLITRDVKKLDGIAEAVVSMGTEMNLDLLKDMGFEFKYSSYRDGYARMIEREDTRP